MPSRRCFLASAALAGVTGCVGGSTDTTETTSGTNATTSTRATTTAREPGTTDETTAEGTRTIEPRTEPPESEVVRWRVTVDAPVVQSPVAGDGAVFVAVGKVEHRQSSKSESTGALAALGARDGKPRWTTELPAAPIDAPRLYDGSAYCVSGGSSGFWGLDNRLHRFAPDGTERWRTGGIDQFLNVLAFGDGRAYLGTNDDALGFDGQRLFAVGASKGRTEWTVEAGDTFDGQYGDEMLLVAPGGGRAVANHDPRTGERRWQREFEPLGSESGSFTVADDVLFVDGSSGADGRFVAVELADGAERWAYADGGGQSFVPTGAAVAGDTVVGTEYGGRVFGLAIADGNERWTFDADGKTRQLPVVADGTVYCRGYRNGADDVIHAVDATSGIERWRATVPGFATWLRPMDDTVFVTGGDDGGTIHALDRVDGTERWSFDTDENLTAPVAADGVVYVASERGIVRALGQ